VSRRLLPLLLLFVVAVGLFFYFDLGQLISLEALARHREWLRAQVAAHPLMTLLAYLLLYIVVVVLSLPVATVMTVAGGFLFGALPGGLYALIGATIGATLLFLIAKTSLGDDLLRRAGGGIKMMQRGFAAGAWSYMFVLRLVPLFPFFLVNLAPAFLGVPLRIYLVATLFGMMPGVFVYALAGSGIGSVLDQGEAISLAGVMTPTMIGALVGLGLLALLPLLLKRFKGEVEHDSIEG